MRHPSIHRTTCLLLAALCGCGSSGGITPNTQGWWRDKVVYELFVRSFADSDGNGVGDLQGVTAHLGDLTDLGVDAIWLMPIFPSPSYHGYDVTDYKAINPAYGTIADFDAMVAAAHQKGIKVLLDMVLNHSSSQHPWFVNSRTGADAAKRSWYDWSATDLGWRDLGGGDAWHASAGAFYYGLFCPCMPDLNLGNAAVEQELTDSMRFWLARGVDGFRLDAVRYYFESAAGAQADLPETHAFLRRLRANLQAQHLNALLVAEAWADPATVATYYGNGDEVQLAFAFDAADGIKSSALNGTLNDFVNGLARLQSSLTGKDLGFAAPFLSNHDQVRTMRVLGGDAGAARVAAATLFAMPGTPFVYYGEEIGMQGGANSANDDRDKRTPMHWTSAAPGYGFTTGVPWYSAADDASVDVASQKADPGSLWSEYKRLIALRHAQPALIAGDVSFPPRTGGDPGVAAVLRTAADKRVLFVANFAAAPAGTVQITASGVPSTLATNATLLVSASGGQITISGLDSHSYVYLSLN